MLTLHMQADAAHASCSLARWAQTAVKALVAGADAPAYTSPLLAPQAPPLPHAELLPPPPAAPAPGHRLNAAGWAGCFPGKVSSVKAALWAVQLVQHAGLSDVIGGKASGGVRTSPSLCSETEPRS